MMTKKEEWRGIPLLPKYEASSLGNVRHVKHKRLRKFGVCSGYYRMNVVELDGTHARHYVHDLVAAAFHGPKPPDANVDHINGSSLDNRPENLQWLSRAENSAKTFADKGGVGLDPVTVAHIKRAMSEGARNKDLAEEYGVNKATISKIRCGRTWKHVGRVKNSMQQPELNLFDAAEVEKEMRKERDEPDEEGNE